MVIMADEQHLRYTPIPLVGGTQSPDFERAFPGGEPVHTFAAETDAEADNDDGKPAIFLVGWRIRTDRKLNQTLYHLYPKYYPVDIIVIRCVAETRAAVPLCHGDRLPATRVIQG